MAQYGALLRAAVKVEFSAHALTRATQRLPHLGLRAIAREIDDAISEGRVAEKPPNWRMAEKLTARRRTEFAWSPNGERVYVLAHRREGYVVLVSIVLGVRRAA